MFVLFFVASHASASVIINEVAWMGNSTNSNAEWIELFNSGGTPVPLDGWTLITQNGTPHITLTGSIKSGGFFLLERTSDATVPNITADEIYTGALSNGGDTIILKDSAGSTIDQVVGGTNWQNIGGDNTTKQTASRTATLWATANATPRATNPSNIIADASSNNSEQSGLSEPETVTDEVLVASNKITQTTPTKTGGAPAPFMTVELGGNRTLETGAGSFFEGHVYNKSGVPLPNARYLWNFGNGETSEGQSIFYAYQYPGRYVVQLFADAGNGYSATGRVIVDVVPAEVLLSQDSDASLIVSNITHAKKELDLSMWRLERGGNSFTIPRGTIVLAGMAVRFAPSILKLPNANGALLLYPDGMVATQTDNLNNPNVTGISYVPALKSSSSKSSAPSSAVGDFSQNEKAQATDVTENANIGPVVEAVNINGISTKSLSVAGAASVTLLGVAGVLYKRRRTDDDAPVEDNTNIMDFNKDDNECESFDEEKLGKDKTIRDADALALEFTMHTKG